MLLLLRCGLGKVGKGLTTLVLGVLDDVYEKSQYLFGPVSCETRRTISCMEAASRRERVWDVPAPASLEKFPVHSTKVEPSLSPLVTG